MLNCQSTPLLVIPPKRPGYGLFLEFLELEVKHKRSFKLEIVVHGVGHALRATRGSSGSAWTTRDTSHFWCQTPFPIWPRTEQENGLVPGRCLAPALGRPASVQANDQWRRSPAVGG